MNNKDIFLNIFSPSVVINKSVLKERYDYLFDDLNFENTEQVVDIIMKSYREKEYDKSLLVYNDDKDKEVLL